jgi:hypothetical protein
MKSAQVTKRAPSILSWEELLSYIGFVLSVLQIFLYRAPILLVFTGP